MPFFSDLTDDQSPEELAASVFSVLDRLLRDSTGDVACAVSGGGDSLALVCLLAEWAKDKGRGMKALTVDHGLRPEAKAEALQVADWLQGRGIDHQILTVLDEAPMSNIQMWAREARYGLMEQYCLDNSIGHLLVGHTRDDQAETLVMRLLRGSGVDGLAAIAESVVRPSGVTLLRPLLGESRQSLRTYLKRLGQAWLEDPSNDNMAFTRVQVRKVMGDLQELGGSPERLSETAKRMAQASEALQLWANRELPKVCTVEPAGYLTLKPESLKELPVEIGQRVLAAVFQGLSGQAYKPRYDKLCRLYDALVADAPFAGSTFQGWQLVAKGGEVLVFRESRSYGDMVEILPGEALAWDAFVLRYKGKADGLTLSVLGQDRDGLALLRESQETLPPRDVWESLPVVRQGQEIIAFPSLRIILKNDLGPIECDFCHNLTKFCG